MSNTQFKAISLSYKTTPLEVRNLFSLSEELSKMLLLQLKSLPNIEDIFILSTCNRTEIYYSATQDYKHLLVASILSLKGIESNQDYNNYFVSMTDHKDATQHLFDVAMGLESQVVGDMQISNQVKKSYQLAVDLDTAGPFLHRLLHTIFFTNKRVVQETAFRSGAASSSYATVELIEELASDMKEPNILVVGLGEIGTDVCKNLQNSFIENITITNRTRSKAEDLAKECNMQVLDFEELWQGVTEADIIISSLPIENYFNKKNLKNLDVTSFKYFIDLSVPQSVAQEVEDLTGILLYNIDNINLKASKALERRLQAIPEVKQIVSESLQDFSKWTKETSFTPAVQKLKQALDQIRQEEMQRYGKGLSEQELKKVDKITKSMMQKIIKLPVLRLKQACKRDEAEGLAEVLLELFDVEKKNQNA